MWLSLAATAFALELRLLPWSDRAPQTFLGINLQASREDVRYRLGAPPYVFDRVGTCPNGGQAVYTAIADSKNAALPKGRADADFDDWVYGDTDNQHYWDVHFAFDRVVGLACYDFVGYGRRCPILMGIGTGDTEERVRRRLGAPSTSRLDEGVKFMRYERYGLTLQLEKARV
jgi:hypothetical protein